MIQHFNKNIIGRFCAFFVAAAIAALAGCPGGSNSDSTLENGPPSSPRLSVTLHVVVVNEPELAEAIHRLRGEWAERFGGELSVTSKPWTEIASQKSLDADVILFPSRYLGELCVLDWLRPVRSNIWKSEDLQATDFFPLVRHELVSWGGEPMALPLGISPVGILHGTASAGLVSLLALAAPQAISKDRLGVLFDTETMKPRIAEQPFVDALAQLAESESDAAHSRTAQAATVPVLGYADRLAAVTESSRNAATAFKLLEWLATPETSSQIARAAKGMLPPRQSLASSPAWYESNQSASERAEAAKALTDQLGGQDYLLVPRIPGIDEYLAALEDGIHAALNEGIAPQAALEKVSQRWEEITEAHGRHAQRAAYHKHLGIAGP